MLLLHKELRYRGKCSDCFIFCTGKQKLLSEFFFFFCTYCSIITGYATNGFWEQEMLLRGVGPLLHCILKTRKLKCSGDLPGTHFESRVVDLRAALVCV